MQARSEGRVRIEVDRGGRAESPSFQPSEVRQAAREESRSTVEKLQEILSSALCTARACCTFSVHCAWLYRGEN